jgi:hypothetical protein
LRKRTAAPPLFSAMNSTPADSRAARRTPRVTSRGSGATKAAKDARQSVGFLAMSADKRVGVGPCGLGTI